MLLSGGPEDRASAPGNWRQSFLTGSGMNGGAARQNFPHLANVSPLHEKLSSLDNQSNKLSIVDDGSHPLTSILDTETDGPYRPTARETELKALLSSQCERPRSVANLKG